MCSRHAELGAGHPDSIGALADALADYLVASAYVEALTCEACSLPAKPGDTYCVGHARLMDYTPTDENHWAANE
jgi:hypothetical protein